MTAARTTAVSALVGCVALLAAATGAGCASEDETQAGPAPPVATAAPARTFAPLLVLDERDHSFPLGTDTFLEHSTLEWSGGACPFEVNIAAGPVSQEVTGEGAPRIDPRRLGGPRPYRYRPPREGCDGPPGPAYDTTDLTRPYAEDGRPPGLEPDAGFNLDVLRDTRDPGGHPPVYHRLARRPTAGGPGIAISYWMLFHRERNRTPDGEPFAKSEGDWERIDVLATRLRGGRYRPSAVRLHRDGPVETVPWTDLELANGPGGQTHPVIYLARGSHAPYATPGDHRRRIVSPYDGEPVMLLDEVPPCETVRCRRWRGWAQLRSVAAQPWYGYRGGWGARGSHSLGSGPSGPEPPAAEDTVTR